MSQRLVNLIDVALERFASRDLIASNELLDVLLDLRIAALDDAALEQLLEQESPTHPQLGRAVSVTESRGVSGKVPFPGRLQKRRALVHKRLRIFTVVAIVVAICAAVVGSYAYVFGIGGNDTASAGTLPTFLPQTSAPATTTTTQPPTTTTTVPKQPQPVAMKMPDPGRSLGIGSRGPIVLAYEQRLASLHIDPGPVDGVYDQKTAYAIDTVEKIYGIQRDGQVGPQVRFALSAFRWPKPLAPGKVEPDRVEVSLDNQYLVVYEKNWVKLITTVSTGGGYAFCGGDEGCQYAVTPPGRFTFQWYFNGWRTSKLGHLYKPYYFNGGIAIHGYPEVPNHPASHGCVRIPMHIADYFHTYVHNGFPIYVVGTPSHELGVKPPQPPRPPPTTTTSTTKPKTTTTTKPKTTTTTKPKTTTTT